MEKEIRMAGEYEVIHALHIGDKEFVVGENQGDPDSPYMCAVCRMNSLFALYDEIIMSDDYAGIIQIFGERVTEQAEKTRVELMKPEMEGIDNRTLKRSECTLITRDVDLHGKFVVLSPDSLRREYRHATHQIQLCRSGFGASPNSRGSACFCLNLYTGSINRYERTDIMGVLEMDQIPEWAKRGYEEFLQREEQEKKECR